MGYSKIANKRCHYCTLFSVAAKHLSFRYRHCVTSGLTQGGVSHRIKKLEQQLKFNLFVREDKKPN